jgi:hypothetical protein
MEIIPLINDFTNTFNETFNKNLNPFLLLIFHSHPKVDF